eukprot:scaffold2644_cov63-Phaeocystis_antarctica.AAC.2
MESAPHLRETRCYGVRLSRARRTSLPFLFPRFRNEATSAPVLLTSFDDTQDSKVMPLARLPPSCPCARSAATSASASQSAPSAALRR